MGKKREAIASGTVVGRHQSWRGAMISVAVTLSESEWEALTRSLAVRWLEVEEDFDVCELTLDERIALFVSSQTDRWSQRIDPDRFANDLGEDAPF